jgi:hypothetical protein
VYYIFGCPCLKSRADSNEMNSSLLISSARDHHQRITSGTLRVSALCTHWCAASQEPKVSLSGRRAERRVQVVSIYHARVSPKVERRMQNVPLCQTYVQIKSSIIPIQSVFKPRTDFKINFTWILLGDQNFNILRNW